MPIASKASNENPDKLLLSPGPSNAEAVGQNTPTAIITIMAAAPWAADSDTQSCVLL
jgi:anthranilate/para-aminobenzoate synthase component II